MKAPMFTRATAVAALLGAALALGCDNGGDVAAPGSGAILEKVTSTSGNLATQVPAFAAAIGAVDNAGAPGRHDATATDPSRPQRISWARSSSDLSMLTPKALAVARLIVRSNFMGISTGRSLAREPRKIRSTKVAT